MADDSEHPAAGGPASGGSADPAAVAISLGQGGPLDPRAAAYLEKQSRLSDEQLTLTAEQIQLTRLQAEDLRREDRIRHWSLRVRHVSDVMKLAFEVCVAIILIVIVVFLGAAIWTAASDNSLIIDAFNVPKEMEDRGLTGQVVAAQLQDKLAAMQAATDSGRPAASYANNWNNDIKVEIPNTGVSIGEFYRYLAKWLGHQTHITGEVFRTPSGALAVTARTGDDSATVTGPDADFDKLMQQAAEKIYERTQPYRYGVYLYELDPPQIDKALPILNRLAHSGSPRDQVWAHVGLSNIYAGLDPFRAPEELREAARLDPQLGMPDVVLAGYESILGHYEAALHAAEKGLDVVQSNSDDEITPRSRGVMVPFARATIAFLIADYPAALAASREAAARPSYAGPTESANENIAAALTALHEETAAERAWKQLSSVADGEQPAYAIAQRAGTLLQRAYLARDWRGVLVARAGAEQTERDLVKVPGNAPAALELTIVRDYWPYVATAMAMTGDAAGAHRLIDGTALDCYPCVLARADVAAAEKDWKAADDWYVRAIALGPSFPFADYNWGLALVAKGDFAGAVLKFEQAHEKGPHWADPLEAWGEVLLAEHHADDAAEKFEAANEFAPRWGRLHLKWGEALLANGDKDGANAQFDLAARLDLSSAEKTELAKVSLRHG